MAAGRLPKPGSEYGPCVERCEHRDCAANRAQAQSPCRICGEPIGYERPFFQESDSGQPLVLAHALCALDEEARSTS